MKCRKPSESILLLFNFVCVLFQKKKNVKVIPLHLAVHYYLISLKWVEMVRVGTSLK